MLTVWDNEQRGFNIVGNNDGVTRIVACLVWVDADITLSTLIYIIWLSNWVLFSALLKSLLSAAVIAEVGCSRSFSLISEGTVVQYCY